MGIQSSLNSLLSQAQMLATFYKGFDKADKIIGDQAITKNEAKIQTDIAAGNAPMKDGKVDPEWLKQRRDEFEKKKKDEFYNEMFDPNGNLSGHGKHQARLLQNRINRGIKLDSENNDFYNNPRVQEYLKSQATNSELKNKVASDLARASVEARTNSINQSKADFNEHTANLIKKYGKGSGNP